MEKLGIIGGMGPMATILFLQKIIAMTEARTDQDHIEMVVEHCPTIPDRTRYILDPTAPSPLEPMVRAGRDLAAADAAMIAIPCVTAHFFHEQLCARLPVPVVNGVAETAEYLSERGRTRVGVMATDGTVRSRLFETELARRGIACVYPSEARQRLVTEIIYDGVKAGRPLEREKLAAVTAELRAQGAEVILLGCTELSVAAQEWLPADGDYLDVLDVLARKCVLRFGRLRAEYRELL